MVAGMSPHVFISHSSEDRSVASKLCDALERRGLACWLDSRDIGPGENFQEAIVKAIRSVRVMVLVFSSNANNSSEIKKEIALASKNHLVVIPLRVEDVLPSDAFLYELSTRQWIDAFVDWELAIGRLADQISGIDGRRGAAPALHQPGTTGGGRPHAPARSRRVRTAWLTLAVSIAGVLGVSAGVAWWITRNAVTVSAGSLELQLVTALAESLPRTSPKYHEDTSRAFAKLGRHRAIAVARHAEGTWRTGDWPTREIAEEKVLEKCQQFYDEPCAVIGADDAIVPSGADGTRAIRDMPRVHYTGLYNPERLPGVREEERQRPEIAGYATAPGPKAVAFHASGAIHVATGAPSQRDAEERALDACNRDKTHREAPGPCYLYAVANKVVLPLRSVTPITPELQVPPPSPASPASAATAAAAPASSAFRVALSDAMAKIAPMQQTGAREAQVAAYQNSRAHKAIAVFPPSSSWRVLGLENPAVAEEHVLEGCQTRHGGPCVLVAVDEAIQVPASDGHWPYRTMPRAGYEGLFDPQQIPSATEALRQRSDVAGYRATQGAKAAAFHPWGRVFIATGTATQWQAEDKALAECNADPQRNGQGGSCLLYAVGDQVVLTKRSTTPITTALPP